MAEIIDRPKREKLSTHPSQFPLVFDLFNLDLLPVAEISPPLPPIPAVLPLVSAATDCFSSSTWVANAEIRARFYCLRDFLGERTVLPSP